MHVVACQGGGLNGIKHVPVLEGLYELGDPDLQLGVSTGALTGVFASAGKLKVFRDVLADIDDKNSVNGVKGIMGLAMDGKGWYGLNTLERLLKEHISLHDLRVPFGAGVTLKEAKEYVTLYSHKMKKDHRLHRAVLGSCAVSGVWSPQKMHVRQKVYTVVDGGHIHSIPLVPMKFQGLPVTRVDVILSVPMARQADFDEPEDMFHGLVWLLEAALAQTMTHGLEYLRRMAKTGVEVRIFNPRTKVGGYAKADAETIQAHLAEGEWMLRHPVVL